MKKTVSFILSILMIVSLTLISGCSDFSFNPLGEWLWTDDILCYGDELKSHDTVETMPFELVYVFEKSGTGYIRSGGQKTLSFTYEYDDENVTITTTGKKGEVSIRKFQLSDDGKQLSHIEYYDDGYNETFIFEKQ